MIVGYGLDVVNVARIERLITGDLARRFLERVFTVAERSYCDGRPAARAAHYAGRFAAKEALVKALGAPEGLSWQDIEVSSGGPPRLTARGRCAEALNEKHATAVHLSLTHDGGVAVAGVILEA